MVNFDIVFNVLKGKDETKNSKKGFTSLDGAILQNAQSMLRFTKNSFTGAKSLKEFERQRGIFKKLGVGVRLTEKRFSDLGVAMQKSLTKGITKQQQQLLNPKQMVPTPEYFDKATKETLDPAFISRGILQYGKYEKAKINIAKKAALTIKKLQSGSSFSVGDALSDSQKKRGRVQNRRRR